MSLPTGLRWHLTHVQPTMYDEDGYSTMLGWYQFASDPVDGKVWHIVRPRELFWFGYGLYYTGLPGSEENDRVDTLLRLRRGAVTAWGEVLPPPPPEPDYWYHDDCYYCEGHVVEETAA